MSAASAQRIVRAVEKRDRVVMVGMNHRYRPDVQIVRSFVQSGELGTIESVRGSWHVFRPEPQPARLAAAARSGGRRRDAGPGAVDPRSGTLAGRKPRAGAGERQPRRGGKERVGGAVRQRLRRLRERHVALRGRDLAPPRAKASGSGSACGAARERAAINPLTVWKELHGVPMDVSPTGVGQPGERLHRLVPGRVGPLRGGHRRGGQGSRAPGASHAAPGDGRDLPLGARTGETWCCEAARQCDGVRCSRALLPDGRPRSRQAAPLPDAAQPPGSELTVYLMTMGPGKRVWERFGHNAIWIHDPASRPDTAYNYGLFDFQQENFLLRFIRGRCGTGWRAFPPRRTCGRTSGTTVRCGSRSSNLPPAARLELQRVPPVERAAGAPVLPLRLLP